MKLTGKKVLCGFKFILQPDYPSSAPIVYYDGPESPEIIESTSYLSRGNRILFDYLINWAAQNKQMQKCNEYNLNMLLVKIYELYDLIPPISNKERFGEDIKKAQEEEWEVIPAHLLNEEAKEKDIFRGF